MEMDKVILEKKQLLSAVDSEMSILIKTFIFKYISRFICSDMCLLHANVQTAGLRKLEKGILIKNMNSMIKTKKCEEKKSHIVLQLFLSPHVRLLLMGLLAAAERPTDPLIEIWCQWVITGRRGPYPHSQVRSILCTDSCLLQEHRRSPCVSRS